MEINKSVETLNQLLESHVAGALPLPLEVMAKSHLEISAKSRKYVSSLEAVAGLVLEQNEPAQLGDAPTMLADILNKKSNDAQAIELPCETKPASAATDAADWMPSALREFAKFDDVPWRSKLPGFKFHKLEDLDGCEAELLWIAAGRAMPSHTHNGSEFTLVLQGSFSDENGEYKRGDVAIADHKDTHRPIAGEGEPCICFAVTSGPLKLKGPIGQRVRDIFGV